MLSRYSQDTNIRDKNLTNHFSPNSHNWLIFQKKYQMSRQLPKVIFHTRKSTEKPDLRSDLKFILVNYSSLRFEIQRLRNECNFLIQQVDQMKRQNSNDKFPSKMKEYLLKSDKQIASVEILIQQSQVSL